MNRTRSEGVLAWFAGNHVAANIIMLALIVAGTMLASTMRTEVFPQIDPRTITVSVAYPGANPEEVEASINTRVEGALTGVSGVKRISSSAAEGLGTITAALTSFADADAVQREVSDAVAALANFPPEGADDPTVEKSRVEPQLMTLALYGNVGERALRQTAERLRSELLATNQLSDVALGGVRAYEVSIEVSDEVLRRYELTFETIAQKITNSSLDLAAGSLKTDSGEILLRSPGKRVTAEGFGAVPILVDAAGKTVRLADIGTVRDGFAETDLINLYNGQPSVFVTIYRAAEQGVLDAEAVVLDYLDTVDVPPGIALEIRDNDTDQLRDRINLMLRNALLGFAFVFLSLVLFLDLKLAFWTSLAIPVSFLGGLAIAALLGASINMVSLFALIIVLGIVVDDAVVVGENIFEAQSQGGDAYQATLRGLTEVAAPVTLGVLTTTLAFLPLAFTTGTIGQIVSIIPIVVIAILLVSLFESLFILPAHLSSGGSWSLGPMKGVQRAFAGGLDRFTRYCVYPVVRAAVALRYATIVAVICSVFIAVTAIFTGTMRFVFLPPTEADRVELTLTMVEGVPFATTRTAALAALRAAEEVNAKLTTEGGAAPVVAVSATIGQAALEADGPGGTRAVDGANIAQVRVDLLPSDQRQIGSADFERMWRERLGTVAGADSLAFASGSFELGDDISVELSHPDDAQLLQAADVLQARLARTEGVRDVAVSLQLGKRQLEFRLNQQGEALQLTSADLARQIRRAFFGESIAQLQRGLEEAEVVLRYPPEARRNLSDVYAMSVTLPGGDRVPLTAVANIREARGFSTIERADGRRVLSLTGKVDSAITTADTVNGDLEAVLLPQLQAQFPGLTAAIGGDEQDRQQDVANILGSLGIAMMAIFVLLAAFTRSYILPVVILTTVIYGVLGAIAGHALLGFPLTFVSLFGVVALAGVVINDTILLLDDYRRRLDAHPYLAKPVAISQSAARRFRPILMTTLTTAFGLMPMIYEPSEQAQFLVPMAISLGFGIMIATPILLLAIPATLLILDDIGRPFRWLWHPKRDLPKLPDISQPTHTKG